MASESQERKQHDQEIRYLASTGMSQRAIARRLGVSRPLVQRVLNSSASPVSVTVPVDVPDDFGEVNSDFSGLVESARASDSLDGWRNLHEVARTCYGNGYRVRYNPLPLLMALSAAQSAGVPVRVRQAYSAEISAIYQDMRDWKIGNYAIDGDRGGVPEFRLTED